MHDVLKEFVVRDTIAIFFGKMLATALVTAIISMAGVYFVVDMSQRGIETAIETTNKRIDDLRGDLGSLKTDLVSRIDLKFEALQLQLKNEFDDTRREFKKAELDTGVKIAGALPEWRPVGFGTVDILLDPNAASLRIISKTDPLFADWARAAGNVDEANTIMASGLMIAAVEKAGKIDVQWVGKTPDGDILLTEFLKFKDCATISQMSDGSAVIVPVASKSVVGNDGFLCKPTAR
jgi:hypothetical protein